MAESQDVEKGSWEIQNSINCVTTGLSFPVTVSLKPAGNAPTLNKKKFLVEGNRTMGWMHQWLRKNLKCEPDESMVRLMQLQ